MAAEVVDDELDDMMSMDLDSLLNMEVSVASKSNEKLSDAPGIVGVISRREIDAFGYKTLADILNRCTSMYFLGADNFFFNQMNIRGMTPKQYDTHTLILLNGRPIRDNVSAGFNAVIYNAFPVESIDHIEIIRGPGSVLYGSNAYAGVINIVTLKAPSELGGAIRSTYGSFATRMNSVQAWMEVEDFNAMITLKNHEEFGDKWKWTDDNGSLGKRNMAFQNNDLLANLNYKNFSFNTFI
ncbi:MAG: TonB-dependent receptor plug domain-containing protein, partial [Desulfobulbaceae bacterium]|nr:TonB-dependent receptor plug domain-containing protein [Desulfobulbaceae bacterium]